MAAPHLTCLKSVSESSPAIPNLMVSRKIRQTRKPRGFFCRKPEEIQEEQQQLVQTTRRAVLGFASIALIVSEGNNKVLAKDNGFWIDGPLPIPPVYNNIGNEKTGTRTFLKKGVYIADLQPKGRMYRVKKYAFDLLAMSDLVGPDTLNYVKKYLRLKSTFMYYDFDKIISAAAPDDKQPLLDLANRLFDNFEKLEDAARRKDFPETESCYRESTVPLLQEVMARMA